MSVPRREWKWQGGEEPSPAPRMEWTYLGGGGVGRVEVSRVPRREWKRKRKGEGGEGEEPSPAPRMEIEGW